MQGEGTVLVWWLMEPKLGGWCFEMQQLVSNPLGLLAGNHTAKPGTTWGPVPR